MRSPNPLPMHELESACAAIGVDLSLFSIGTGLLEGMPIHRGPASALAGLALAIALAEHRVHDGSGDVYLIAEATADVAEPVPLPDGSAYWPTLALDAKCIAEAG